MSSEVSPGLIIRRAGSVVHLVLDAQRKRNALSRPMLIALEAALVGLDEDVIGVVISGSGGSFSAGADFEELTGTSEDLGYDDAVSRVREAIRHNHRLVVAAIEGPCLGAAADLALSCDVRVASVDSYLQVPAVRLGLLYNPDVINLLAQSYPLEPVRRLLLLGERFPASTAAAFGLVTNVVPRGQAVMRAEDLLTQVSADSLPAVAATKALLTASLRELPDSELWQSRRRALLDSPQRNAAIADAHARHVRPTPIER